jgi:sec-independent protein translocase protein TatC
MTFWEHLDELRKVIFRGLGLILLFMVVIFIGKDYVFNDVILAPIGGDFALYRWFNAFFALIGLSPLDEFSLELINIDLAAQFFIHIKVSFYLAFVVAFPFIVYLIWGFISPALYSNEKGVIKSAFGFASILFYAGVAVGYFFVFPLTLRFLGTYQVSPDVPNQISLSSYIAMFIRLILVMGIVFEMPALAAILSRLGVIHRGLLRKYRKHAVVVLMVLAAVITPSGDAFTLFMVALPLYMLYEMSILMCKEKVEEAEE